MLKKVVSGMFSRRHILAGGAAAVAFSSAAQASHIPVKVTQRLVVLGDSYSDPNYDTQFNYTPFPNWAELLVSRGRAATMRNFALSGATARTYSSAPVRGTFKSQLDQFLANPGWGTDDVTVVYFGYNDIARSTNSLWSTLTQSKIDYRTGVDRLIAAGAMAGKRRLILTSVHDWSKNPKTRAEYVTRTRDWLTFTYDLLSKRPGVINANIYRRITDVMLRPQVYGLNNVTTADVTRSQTTALFLNGNHFGAKGHQILADEFSTVLDFVVRSRR
ncbi:MAG TPA: SGNH/GDSL hydrolase family protein [Geminicoccus sp.]|jgi:phospholipase/lecithinase/hemolysin|uniref:SGNH/GDSL hydrolase family protein n=1 Tax=Geminicoccus sp. TaxID=2024832 RepID=UPI002E3303AC|nr:SGNH/GDSL hydrolase family protein [Geminicoccus sp.]HEX2527015.1 SGNH/GDSL hydrolase family protein [Geminicoccus sp.]